MGGPAAAAAEHGNAGCLDDRIADGLLRSERVDREHRVRVAVLDDGEVGGEDEALDGTTEYLDAARLVHCLGHLEDVVSELGLDDGNTLPCGGG